MAYPPQFIERLRNHFLLSDLIGRKVALKKRGREYTGLCPFHGEKTPSFTVNNEKGFFHCFGCAAHGDAIEFMKRYERLTWVEAIERLAREAGIPLPVMSREEVEKAKTSKGLLDAMEAACAWFEKNVSAPEYSAVRDYLRQRSIAEETKGMFRIGYAPEMRDGLKRHLIAQGFTEAVMIECGLLIKPESGPAYDRFRSRLIFPIRNTRGQVIAFGGRLMDAQARHAPKYLNSPETELFKKGEVLFNLDRAGSPAREQENIVIVEGYMDAVSMVQAGITNVVATLGTAVTAEHLRTLWQYASEPVLCLDGDAAGQRAMLRAAETALPLLRLGLGLRFAVLPPGEDPDSLIRAQGAAPLTSALQSNRALGLAETLWAHFSREAQPTQSGLTALEKTLTELASRINDPTMQRRFKSFFYDKLRAAGKKYAAAGTARRSSAVEIMATAPAAAMHLKPVRQLLKLLLLQPALLQASGVEEQLAHMDCISPALEALREALLEAVAEGVAEDAARLRAHLDEIGLTHATASLLNDAGLPVPRQALESLANARATWNQAVQMAAYEAEIRQIAALDVLDEEALTRLKELKNRVKELKDSAKMAHATLEDE